MHDHNSQFENLPPADAAAEQCLVGSLMLLGQDLSDPIFDEVLSIVGHGDFFSVDAQSVFDVLRDLRATRRPADAIIVRDELRRRGLFEEIGGDEYLGRLLTSVPSAVHAPHYARIVREKSQLRRLIQISSKSIRDAQAPAHSDARSADVAREAMTALAPIACDETRARITPINQVMLEVYERMERGGVATIPTGITDLDDKTGGIGLGEMWIVAARPSMGKSLFAKQIMLNVARDGTPVAMFSLEENQDKIGRNVMSAVASIENRRVRRGQLDADEWSRAASTVAEVSKLPIFVLDRTRDIADIQSMISLLTGKYGVKLIILDYLQRVGGLAYKSRYEEVSKTSVMISDAIKDSGAGGLILAQLNRAVEGRDDKRPTMGDLRDSGQIEQDADGILLLHREDYYHIHEPRDVYEFDHIAELIIAKCRDGERGHVVKLHSELKYQRFAPYVDLPSFN